MSMTELERVELTCRVMERQFPIGTKPDWIDCTLANELLHYWDARRRELEAAEKPNPHMTIWETLNSANAKIERLESRVGQCEACDASLGVAIGTLRGDCRTDLRSHEHCNGTSGQCYFPDEPTTEGDQP
ncbi:hypothetical protein LCGC14_1504680 [marine sediment metagenome]|uniref:Uncharacterized protein n=1 Tax=marine sediment metagenome TaxID=412755 RepID=A0A0F9JNV0_9ZZZZ